MSQDPFTRWLDAIKTQTYYGMLRLTPQASPADVKRAFHELALHFHPDQYAGRDPALAGSAGEVFKRIVEAYNILSSPELRAKYDLFLAVGKIRMDPNERPPEKKKVRVRTLEEIAQDPRAKKSAKKADAFLDNGNLEAARLALTEACNGEPFNQELKDRLRLIYEAIALE